MKEHLEKRLKTLREEFETGQKMLADLEAKQKNLRETLLRISGAIQALEEVLAEANQTPEEHTALADRASSDEPAATT